MPQDWSGISKTNQLTATINSIGKLKVAASNTCGNSSFTELQITPEMIPDRPILSWSKDSAFIEGQTRMLFASIAPNQYKHQWYKNHTALTDDTLYYLDTKQEGLYYATFEGNCPTENSDTVELSHIQRHILVDQFGYLKNAEKVAIIKNPVDGYDNDVQYSAGNKFWVIDASSLDTVFAGIPTLWKNGATHDQSGDQVWWFDFSVVSDSGHYYIVDSATNASSTLFRISDHVYNDAFMAAVKSFYYQRINFDKTATYAGNWADAACYEGANQDKHARSILDPTNAALEMDLSGGWFDAGDYNKYTNPAALTLRALLSAYYHNQVGLSRDDLNIPESGNGIPDILDEIKWEMDWLLKMQLPSSHADAGAVLHKLSSTSFSQHKSPPSTSTEARYYAPPTTGATASACAAFALGSIVYDLLPSPSMQSYADQLKNAAISAWNYLDQNKAYSDYDNAGFSTARFKDAPSRQANNRASAAAYLYYLTGNTNYRLYFDDTASKYNPVIKSSYIDPFDELTIESALFYTLIPGATSSIVNMIKSNYMSGISNSTGDYYGKYKDSTDAYRAYLRSNFHTWGSNQVKGQAGVLMRNVSTYGLNPSPNSLSDYENASSGYLHYIHGCNPIGKAYLSNVNHLGVENSVNEFFHMWFSDGTSWDNVNTSFGPAPGFVPGGPNKQYEQWYSGKSTPPLNQPVLKAFTEKNNIQGGSDPIWVVNENGIYYQGAYIKLLSKWVTTEVDTPAVGIESIAFNENIDSVRIKISLTKGFNSPIYVDFKTVQGSAVKDVDYKDTANTLLFEPYTRYQTLVIPIYRDNYREGDETFEIHLSNAINATMLNGVGKYTILDVVPECVPCSENGAIIYNTTKEKIMGCEEGCWKEFE